MPKNRFSVLLLVLFLSACFKDDERLPPVDVTLIPNPLQSYTNYFDFETDTVVKFFPVQNWQLGFECGAGGWHIVTNSGSEWFMYNTGKTIPDAETIIPTDLEHLFDVPASFPDSTAVGNWVSGSPGAYTYTHTIYLLGHYVNGRFNDVKELVFLEVNDTSYRFSYKEQDSGLSDTVRIIKNDATNYVYFNFSTKEELSLEPNKEDWDLAFVRYYDMATLFSVTIPYPVGGSYINAGHTEAALDSVNRFEDIDAGMLSGYQFRTQRDIPGYRWKDVSVDATGGGTATYKVNANYTYIFHTAQDHYFKLRFVSYTHLGMSGYPQFEFEKLQ